jgi:hypothetical protein
VGWHASKPSSSVQLFANIFLSSLLFGTFPKFQFLLREQIVVIYVAVKGALDQILVSSINQYDT